MRTTAIVAVLSSIVLLILLVITKLENVSLAHYGRISDKEIDILQQQLQDVEARNVELFMTADPGRRVNLSTLEYAAYTRGYNDAVTQAKTQGPTFGYAAGYHAAIEQGAFSQSPETVVNPKPDDKEKASIDKPQDKQENK